MMDFRARTIGQDIKRPTAFVRTLSKLSAPEIQKMTEFIC